MAALPKIPGVQYSGNVMLVDPSMIHIVPDYNVRNAFDPAHDADDAQLHLSLLANGWKREMPGVVTIGADGKIYLLVGHRRLAGTNKINSDKPGTIKAVPMVLETKDATDADRALDLIISNSGKPLSRDERGAVFLRLRAYGWKDAEIASKAGVTTKTVQDECTLAKRDKRLLRLVKLGVVSATLAADLAKVHGDEAARKIIEDAAKNAPATGRKAGKVTETNIGPAERKHSGRAPVVAKKGAAKKGAAKSGSTIGKGNGNGATDTRTAPAMGKGGSVAASLALLHGPFHVTADGTILDALEDVVGYGENPAMANAMLVFLNQGWTTLRGKIGVQNDAAERQAPPAKRKAA